MKINIKVLLRQLTVVTHQMKNFLVKKDYIINNKKIFQMKIYNIYTRI